MSIEGMMNQTITVAAWASNQNSGHSNYGTAVSSIARVEPKVRIIQTSGGQTKTSSARIFVPAGTSIAVGDQVALPSGTLKEVLQVDEKIDGYGATDHKVVWV